MILTVGNVKGGVGKTTLAVNIAITRALAGRDVLLVDGDEQGTALRWRLYIWMIPDGHRKEA